MIIIDKKLKTPYNFFSLVVIQPFFKLACMVCFVVAVATMSACVPKQDPLAKEKDAHRLLLQASFGPTDTLLKQVTAIGPSAWVDQQLNLASAYTKKNWPTYLERMLEIGTQNKPNSFTDSSLNKKINAPLNNYFIATWWENILGKANSEVGSDQLRQRVAYALSQILVVSNVDTGLYLRAEGLAAYYDILAEHAFGNFYDLLKEVARSPVMGTYLSYAGNQKYDPQSGTQPDENFARELMQLFTIGLYELNYDGSPNRDNNPSSYPDTGTSLIPSYKQQDVEELAALLTGWQVDGRSSFKDNSIRNGNYTKSMKFYSQYHSMQKDGRTYIKLLAQQIELASGVDGSGLDAALRVLFEHPNTPTFISKALIQRLVSSNPSADYIARISKVFVNNGKGERGDLKAVIRAILLDKEAREPIVKDHFTGKIKEPLLAYVQFLRAFNPSPSFWKSKDLNTVFVYHFPRPEDTLGQAPLRAKSVFNFYSNDYVPNHNSFKEKQKTAPEMEIQTLQNLKNYHDTVTRNSTVRELLYARGLIRAKPIDEISRENLASGIYIDYTATLKQFEFAMEGDSNLDFKSIRSTTLNDQGLTPKEVGINYLVDYLDGLLMGYQLGDTNKAKIVQQLLVYAPGNALNKRWAAWSIVQQAVKLIATSSEYMVQY